jgi:nitrate/TMAO reductase-like tetraheme cytochrome c subunit
MGDPTGKTSPRFPRLLVAGLVVVVAVLGLALLIMAVGQSRSTAAQVEAVDVLATSRDECVVCHRQSTPGIVEQYGQSTMASAEVSCRDCHAVASDYPGAVEHEGAFVLGQPTPARCERCHSAEVAQFYQSRHSLPAYTAMTGTGELSADHLAMYQAIPEGSFAPDKMRNALFAIEGPEITRFACESCHNVGRPQPDGSVGECQQCHLRHTFSLEQARKPETCNACHIGPDHPQWEIYQESPHGIAYATGGDSWGWEAEPGTLGVSDFPAPTCATCHFSGFGSAGTTHDVGDRLTWYLFAPISERRPSWQDNLTRMQAVCRECHNKAFIDGFYADADAATEAVNDLVRESDAIMAPVKVAGLLTEAPFDEPIDYTYFEAWHHWGRTAKFGMWMQGPDYTQWHGVYELLSDLAELKEMAELKLAGGTE